MAIYHLSMKIISRSSGYSAVASAAYRSGSLMLDERTGLTHDYTRKSGVAEAVILTPATAPAWCTNRAELWNAVEKAECRKNSQLAREIELAIPRELPQDAARETVLAFVRENFVSQGMIADVAFHHMDKTNPHAHIMLTTRAVGPAGFGGKVRDWNDRTHAETWRASWAKYRTRIFERVDLMRDRSGYICDRSEIGQHPPLQRVYSSATFEQLLTQVCQTWPQYTRNLRQPKTWPESFCLGEDRQPAMPSLAARKVDFTQGRLLPTLMPVMSSVDRETRQLQLLLVMGVDDSLGGVVRLNGTLYPAFAVPSADNSQLVISALTDKGLRYAGYGVAVNHDADSHISPAPELMEFHLKTREAPLFAAVNTPEKQPDHLFRSLGFNRTWDEWRREEDARTHTTERRHDRGWSQ
ncbi:MobQ family relaxase [Escherichia coli]|uniref:MobQ family relaxase n=1 Tax=Escherichia coli TaxID=562 RepID=UPI00266BBF3A|nr:MobQ family relaxase [Escherichia coli]WKR68475.1 MobA/MobL family protein [Escherichia coli]